jgi:nucleoside-diphosphate-sugar epimerase
MAKAFFEKYHEDEDTVIFASGVSHSKESDPSQFQRERRLLENTLVASRDKMFVYFSTCSIYDPSQDDTPYVKHKIEMERLIVNTANRYLICRISNVVGVSNNTATIFNYLAQHIHSGAAFKLWKNATRNIIDVEDVSTIVSFMVHTGRYSNQVHNVANPSCYRVVDLVAKMESHFGKKGNYTLVDAGEPFTIDTRLIQDLAEQVGVAFGEEYIERLLQKYYKIKERSPRDE